MRVAHVGPPLARTGGSAGYLWQLRDALRASAPHAHSVSFPDEATADGRVSGRSEPSLARRVWNRTRRSVAGQRFYRPSAAARRQRGGPIGESIARAFKDLNGVVEPCLARALAGDAEVIVTHDVAVAEAALERRRPGQDVWLMLHSPMPMALYLVWNWGVPEAAADEVMSYPDVQTWTEREIDICRRVDRVLLPCAEARDEFVRCDARYAAVLRHADAILTGASRRAPSTVAAVTPQERAALRAKWRLPIDQRVGLFLGSAQAYRGFDALLAGLSLLADAIAIPGTIAVAGPDPLTLPPHDRTRMLGRVDDVDGLLRATDFVVNLNRFSLFDLSLIEATEAARPLVLHETGGNRTFRDLGAGCLMARDLAPRTVASALEEAFTLPDARLVEMGRRSRACYDAHLTPAQFAARHLALYDSYAKRAAATTPGVASMAPRHPVSSH